MMRKLILCLFMLVTFASVSAQVTEEEAKKIDTLEIVETKQDTLEAEVKRHPLEDVVNAIIKVESGGNPRVHNPKDDCAGILQITPVCVKQCNIWLKLEKSKKRYTLKDRYDKEKSLEMFYMYQAHYNPSNDVERAIRIWNGGPGYKKRSTQRYYNKVMSYLK